MLMLPTPLKSLAGWYDKLRRFRVLWTAEAGDAREQEHGVCDVGAGERQPLAGKWPDQTDMMTRLTAPGRVIKLHGSRAERDADTHETHMHRETPVHNVYKFPGMRS